MKYNFDEITDRSNTNSIKWNFNTEFFNDEDIIPMWIADMDFKASPKILEKLKERVNHGIFGYSKPTDTYYDALINWFKSIHNFHVKKEWVCLTPGIIPAINWIIQSYTKRDDKIMIQTPVYHPFAKCIENNKRKVITSPLILRNNKYYMDFEDLKKKMDSSVKLMILCNPHNPVGRVWSEKELITLCNICMENNTLIVSDEIHGDLIFKNNKHTSLASINNNVLENSITCTAASKTFNLAGLQTSNIIIANKKLRNKFLNTMKLNGIDEINPLGILATEVAYTKGQEWYLEVIKYIEENYRFLKEYCKEKLPQVKVIEAEGTYLAWLDFRELGMNNEELKNFMLKKAKVAFNQGYIFGKNGGGFERINIACPRSVLKEALDRIYKAYKNI
ncbi:MalY/PatB family protein [Clostridium rectalis]|uniref:MalY/PatB family protein n=1 Tax=Clostridium rectalis TaxID=2040295 RepID=UPI000F62CBB5|nr:MalY/PatB family protein [Clostridium rectalis]